MQITEQDVQDTIRGHGRVPARLQPEFRNDSLDELPTFQLTRADDAVLRLHLLLVEINCGQVQPDLYVLQATGVGRSLEGLYWTTNDS